jgi:SAM-dependent methyltransferase
VRWPWAKPEDDWTRSRRRWRKVKPDTHLTWLEDLTGDAFIARVREHGGLDAASRVLEVGPGYGRLLKSLLAASGDRVLAYTGVDISNPNVSALRRAFRDPRLRFIAADAETATIPGTPFDLMISSLTFKHLHPSFEALLRNITRHLADGGLVMFDVLGAGTDPWVDATYGNGGAFEAKDGLTWIRSYSRDEIEAILRACRLRAVAFDTVEHMPGRVRTFVVARRR